MLYHSQELQFKKTSERATHQSEAGKHHTNKHQITCFLLYMSTALDFPLRIDKWSAGVTPDTQVEVTR